MAIRSTFAGINTMYRGVSTNRLSLDTVGHNITNANATGYSRQSVNQAAVMADQIYTNAGQQYIGAGVDSLSIQRARDIFADKQYWTEYSSEQYFETRQKNYDKLEAIFNDSDNNGIQNSLEDFYKIWSDLSTNASSTSERVAVLEKGKIVCERINTAAKQIQSQIVSEYDDIKINVAKVNEITNQIVELNKAIMSREAVGGSANDLRDSRDNLADELSGFMQITVSENNDTSMYTIVCNGSTLVNGISKIDLKLGPRDNLGTVKGIANDDYGITDYNIELGDTGVILDPLSGKLRAEVDAIAEDKAYIDDLADMAAYLLTNFNAQHKQGVGMDANCTTGENFFGEHGLLYVWDNNNRCVSYATQTTTITPNNGSNTLTQISINTGNLETDSAGKVIQLKGYKLIQRLAVSTELTAKDGEQKIAARAVTYKERSYASADESVAATQSETVSGTSYARYGDVTQYCWNIEVFNNGVVGSTGVWNVKDLNGTADGSVAVRLSNLLNQADTDGLRTTCAIGSVSMENYYNAEMTQLGVDAQATDSSVIAQEDIVETIMVWRTSVAGVNWDEELSNMIMFQTGYSACSRVLTTMDEMLDRLINSTGVVGR